MESQGKRSMVKDGMKPMPAHMEKRSSAFGRVLIYAVLCWLLWSTVSPRGIVQAQNGPAPSTTSTYVYDANGRLAAVTKGDGTSAPYTYDALGNLVQVGGAIPAGQLALFTFTPSHGEAGTAITINGQGFSSALANDSVSFNGTAATVASASPTQLITSVPAGASAGPITATVGGQAVSSTTPFIVDDTGLPPTIDQITPTIVTIGDSMTVTGTHLDPVPGHTTVQMAGRVMPPPTAVNDSALQYVVPTDGTSGFVTVATPYGVATSGNQVIVLPSGINASSVVSNSYITTNGVAGALNIGATGQIGTVTFSAEQGAWISLQTNNISAAAGNVSYTIYAPGNAMILQGTVSASSPTIHLPQLTIGGTYLALFQSTAAGTQFNISAEANPSIANGAIVTMAAAGANQSKRSVFSANAGDNLEFALDDVNVAGGNSNGVQFNIYNSAGNSIVSGSCTSTGTGACCRYSVWNLMTDTYTVIVSPLSGGKMSFSALLQSDTSGGALTANTPATINAGLGQIQRFTFTANAGDTVALNVSGVSTTPSGQPLYALVYSPTTATITPYDSYTGFNTSSSTTVNLANLPATGTYTVVFYTIIGIPATAQVMLAPQ